MEKEITYNELIEMEIAIIGGKGIWRSFQKEKENTKYIVDLVLKSLMKNYGNVYGVIIDMNKDLGLDLNPEDYYNDK